MVVVPRTVVAKGPTTKVRWSSGPGLVLAGEMPRTAPRILLYSHDTYGLGHFCRATLIARGIVSTSPGAQVLIATGSPQAHAFSLPDRVDSLKLPSVTKDGSSTYRPRKITSSLEELVGLRSSVLQAACREFRPDVVLVDQAPIGMAGELTPLLRSVDELPTRPRLVLGVREIIDDAERTEREWRASGAWNWLERYDDVFVYGDEQILTTAQELKLGRRVDVRVTHTGFVAPVMPEPFASDPFVLVTPDGGGDGHVMLRRYLAAVDAGATRGMRSVIVTGPLMSASRRAELVVRAAALPDVEIVEFTDNMRQMIASASGVVSMAGYNTVVEELASGTPAMLVPRTDPRIEQDIRARRLGPHTNLERCPADQLTPARVASFVDRIGTPPRLRSSFSGRVRPLPRTDPLDRSAAPAGMAGKGMGGVDLGGVDLGGVSRVAALLTRSDVLANARTERAGV